MARSCACACLKLAPLLRGAPLLDEHLGPEQHVPDAVAEDQLLPHLGEGSA